MGDGRPTRISRRRLLRSTAGAPLAAGLSAGATRGRAPPRRARLVSSARPADAGRDGREPPVRPGEFGFVGVFDVDWLRAPRFRRVFEYLSSSPDAFRGVRFFGALSSGSREAVRPAGSPTVWLAPDEPVDFSATFAALERLTARGLTPFVVLSFFPPAVSDAPTEPPASLDRWKHLVKRFANELRADSRFGDDITDWWFEVWNEPNVDTFWKGDFEAYLDLYRATSDALAEAGHADLRLGGPTVAYFSDRGPDPGPALVERFVRFLSENPDLNCDFLSFHGKGSTGGPEPDLRRLATAARNVAETALATDRDRFTDIDVVNDEADMKVGFDDPYEPRMTERFSAWLGGATIAYDALSREFREHGVRFLAASDDANQQLIETPFDGRRSILTRAASTPAEFFKLPVYDQYELHSLLGDRHGTFLDGAEHCFPHTDLFHQLTVSDDRLSLWFAVYPGVTPREPSPWSVEYTLVDVPWDRVNVARFRIDRRHSNAYTAAGRTLSPPPPTPSKARRIRRAQELAVAEPIRRGVALTDDRITAAFSLRPFATELYWMTPYRPASAPVAPAWLNATADGGDVTLRWEPNRERSFYSYEVYRMNDGAPATRIGPRPLRSAIWVDTDPPRTPERYGVRAVSASGGESELATSRVRKR